MGARPVIRPVRELEHCSLCGVDLAIAGEAPGSEDRECYNCSKLSHFERTSLRLQMHVVSLLAAVLAPELALEVQPGVCRECGCTTGRPCMGGCYWADATRTLCSRCA